ncbi:MAG: hypothetical protein KDD85_13370 [Parvularculaceae bacterium]|nr:hypothetical protein [Parvularculaceae bacterium]
MGSVFRRYLLPGFIFQSVTIGGGYGTGREIAEFFLSHGAVGGLLGLCVTTIVWSIMLAICFEFARIHRSFDYRSFFSALLGPFWRVFEALYLMIALLILSVLGSAAGEMIASAFGVQSYWGSFMLLGAIGALAFFGGRIIEKTLAWWSFLLYAVYGVFLVWIAATHGNAIADTLGAGAAAGPWFFDGVRYAAYNLIAFVAVLFVLPHLESRRDAIASGFLAGLIGIIPGVFIFIAMLSHYPAIQSEAVPVLTLLESLNSGWFFALFQIVLFGTFVETGVGIIHSVNERAANSVREGGATFPRWARFAIAAALLLTAIFLAQWIGIIDLIAKGYGALSYGFIAVVAVPLLTVGVYKIINRTTSRPESKRVFS